MNRCLLIIPAMLLPACGSRVEKFVMPDQVTDFTALYGNNCAGCHGRDGRHGAARPLNDPVFLALIGKEKLREVIAGGVPRSPMPAFARNSGGALTDRQVTALATEIEERWSRPLDFAAVGLPPYAADLGNAGAGAAVFRMHCVRCHGEEGMTKSAAGSVLDRSFLSLISDQSLRTSVIAGRSDRGMPDFRKHSPPLAAQDVSDLVAWLSASRGPEIVSQTGMKLP
jgi:mono/diheme cytochrome c family protein